MWKWRRENHFHIEEIRKYRTLRNTAITYMKMSIIAVDSNTYASVRYDSRAQLGWESLGKDFIATLTNYNKRLVHLSLNVVMSYSTFGDFTVQRRCRKSATVQKLGLRLYFSNNLIFSLNGFYYISVKSGTRERILYIGSLKWRMNWSRRFIKATYTLPNVFKMNHRIPQCADKEIQSRPSWNYSL